MKRLPEARGQRCVDWFKGMSATERWWQKSSFGSPNRVAISSFNRKVAGA